MADNMTVTPGTGVTVAMDDVGGVKHQRVKVVWGADGTANDADIASGKPMPMQLRGSDGTDRSSSLKALTDFGAGEYETVAASQTAQVLGATGAAGDFISHILVIPTTVNAGAVTLLDGSTSITVFAGGTASLSNLVPFVIPLGLISVSGAWKLTTGAGLSCIGAGNFT